MSITDEEINKKIDEFYHLIDKSTARMILEYELGKKHIFTPINLINEGEKVNIEGIIKKHINTRHGDLIILTDGKNEISINLRREYKKMLFIGDNIKIYNLISKNKVLVDTPYTFIDIIKRANVKSIDDISNGEYYLIEGFFKDGYIYGKNKRLKINLNINKKGKILIEHSRIINNSIELKSNSRVFFKEVNHERKSN